ncbi:MAG: hypothetical protein PVI53_18930 [Desulfobacteraceae bacterium]|jgi:hypothetical protein
MNQTVQNHENYEADLAVERAIGAYIESRKERIPHFVRKHFSFKGAIRLNRKAFGSDLYKVPLNVAWTIPYITLRASSSLMKKMGLEKFPSHVERLPVGFETKVQKEITWLIFSELLEIPYTQEKRRSEKDALLENILNQPEISSLFIGELSTIFSKSKDPRFRPALEKNLMEYSRSRTAASELAGNIISLSTGASVFGKMTPGAWTVGGGLAAAIAQQTAISNFILGPTVGGLYYAVFPASASMGLVIASTGAVMAALATLTSFSGIIADPIQYKLGLHQKRLNRLIDCLDRELRGLGDSRLKIRDQYVARVFDLADLLKKAARTFV